MNTTEPTSAVIESGGMTRFYRDGLTIHPDLPLGTYKVCFDPHSGYWLAFSRDLVVRAAFDFGLPEDCEAEVIGVSGSNFIVRYTTRIINQLDDPEKD